VTARRAMTVSGISVELSNAGKVFFPDAEITKGDLVGYYRIWPPACCPT
jgi:DNA primase